MNRPMSINEWKRATRMWRAGKNTLEIAEVIGCNEALIYNRLPDWRRQFSRQSLNVGIPCNGGKKTA